MVRRAVQTLEDAGATHFVHLGDVGDGESGYAVIDEMLGRPTYVTFGNCDDESDLAAYIAHLDAPDLSIHHPFGILKTGSTELLMTHGHMPEIMDFGIRSGVHVVMHGHSHEVRDEVDGTVRFLNPGALFRASRYTAGLLHPRTGSFEILEVPRD